MKQVKIQHRQHKKNKKSHHQNKQRHKNHKHSDRHKEKNRYKNQRRSKSSSREQKKPKFEQEIINNVQIKQQKELPCFEPSGILLQFYNSRQGVKLKFHEPPESKEPSDDWRIYPFKGESNLNPILLKNSCYLVGKDERICDILCQNPSISRQHAVIQFREIHKQNVDGTYDQLIFPYIMDLQSTNGTFLNEQQIQPGRYFQILDRDVVKFGLSDRIYVFVKVPPQQN